MLTATTTATPAPTGTATEIPTATPTAAPIPTQQIALHQGWNWVSFALGSGGQVDAVLASIEGRYDYILGERGTYAPPPAAPWYNTLSTLEPGKGYFLRMKESAVLTLTGDRLPADTPIELAWGWHWIGYLSAEARDLPEALASLDGKYSYLLGESGTYAPLPAQQELNTLFRMEPGKGSLIRMTEDARLTYPAPR